MAEEKTLQVEKEEAALEEGAEWTRDRRIFIPRADIYETGDKMVIVLDVPGSKEEDIDITLEKDILTIMAQVNADEFPGHTPLYAEYEVGDYQRSFKLPDELNRDKIEAAYKEGILKLFLPKADKAKIKKIDIKAG